MKAKRRRFADLTPEEQAARLLHRQRRAQRATERRRGVMAQLLPLAAKVGAVVLTPEPRYRCPECETLLDEGESRCPECNRFAARVEGLVLVCPHCQEAVTEEDL